MKTVCSTRSALTLMVTLCLANPALGAEVTFLNSCSDQVAAKINHGVTLLHSFEYPETSKIFKQIINTEPSCAIAYWGAAMSIWHPLWAPPKEQDLQAGAALLATASRLPASQREKDYIAALQVFFSDTDISPHRQRAISYSSAMKTVYERYYATDVDATVFYALSLLASADPTDKTYARQYQSGALLKFAQQSQPTHPGILHYLIHSYDFPGLAHLALEDARIYANTAPESSHAQHMPSHIFTRLGYWELSLASNHDSIQSAEDYTQRGHLPGHYDEGLHSMDYLLYALLQTGRDREARELIVQLAKIDKTDTENFKVAFTYAASQARYTLERRAWREAGAIVLMRSDDFRWQDFPWAESIHYFAKGLGAARSGDLPLARSSYHRLLTLQKALNPNDPLYWQVEVNVQADMVNAWIQFMEGSTQAALALASSAADQEDAVDKHPVTPGEVLPARELYADMLAEHHNFRQALQEYQTVLKHSPNRLNAMTGAALCAQKTGDTGLARTLQEAIATQTKQGSREISMNL